MAGKRYQETSTDNIWYMGEYYEIKAAYRRYDEWHCACRIYHRCGTDVACFPLAKDNTDTKVQECRLTLKNGVPIRGIGLRAVDAAGNISEEYHLANQHKQYIQLVVDNRIQSLTFR